MPKKLVLIAETDGEGRVVCLWRRGPNERIARPLSAGEADVAELRAAQLVGAEWDAVSRWVARRERVPATLNLRASAQAGA